MRCNGRLDFMLARRAACALLIALPSLAGSRGSIVLLDVAIADVSPISDVEAIRARLSAGGNTPRGWLVSSFERQGYTVIDGPAIDGSIGGLQGPAASCAEAECATRLAKMVHAERAAFAKVTKVSSIIWVLDATLVDTNANRVLRREQLELKGDIAQLLPQAMSSMARRFAAADAPAGAGPPPLAPGRERTKPTRDQVLALLSAASERAPADLTGFDLSGMNLTGTDFRRADLSGSRLVGANLSGARLFGVKLTDAVASGAVLAGAVLDLAVLERTDLTGADLHDASLYATILTGAVLVDADLTRARIISTMTGANLTRAKLVHADLGAHPGNQPMGLMRTDLSGAILAGADLSHANLRKVNFARADLSGANLEGADVAGADFMDATLRAVRGRSRLRGSDQAKNLDPMTSGD